MHLPSLQCSTHVGREEKARSAGALGTAGKAAGSTRVQVLLTWTCTSARPLTPSPLSHSIWTSRSYSTISLCSSLALDYLPDAGGSQLDLSPANRLPTCRPASEDREWLRSDADDSESDGSSNRSPRTGEANGGPYGQLDCPSQLAGEDWP